jgi:hypothetical protein
MENEKQGAFACAADNGYQQGLTKKEYFAATAMQGYIATGKASNSSDWVRCADELLKVLETKSNLSHRGYSLRDKELLLQFFSAGNECGCMEHENIEDYFEQYYNETFKSE